jgi:hypothetical protein
MMPVSTRWVPYGREWIIRLGLVLLGVLGGAGCQQPSQGPELGGETNWLKWCESAAECPSGQCVCGVCSAPCSEDAMDCAGGPPASSCFAEGSFGHAALCAGSDAAGICLPACSSDSDCGSELSCVVGACVPPAPSTIAPGSSSSSSSYQLFDQSWLPEGQLALASYAELCSSATPCLSMDEMLLGSSCMDVEVGCGMVHLTDLSVPPLGSGGREYWYTGFGEPPIGVYMAGARSGGRVSSTRDLECSAIEVRCSSCSAEFPCDAASDAWPEPPPPEPVPGCVCEPDGVGRARVSLDCFCGIYGCPGYVELADPCVTVSNGRALATQDSCGQIWFKSDAYRGVEYAFDGPGGALLGAEAFSPGPFTTPCNTARVVAGEARDCVRMDVCACRNPTLALPEPVTETPPLCSGVSWL